MFKKMAAVLLILIGLLMLYLGFQAGIQAPIVTALGFFVIAAVFLLEAGGSS